MSLSIQERRRVISETAPRFQQARKGQKSIILKEFIALTDLDRHYAAWVLREQGRKLVLKHGPHRIVFQKDVNCPQRRKRDRRYPIKLLRQPILDLWEASGYLCSRRLVVFMQAVLHQTDFREGLSLSEAVVNHLLTISSSSIDRLIRPMRQKFLMQGRSHTRPGALFSSKIPISPHFDQNFKIPGHLQIDLVGHDGGTVRGENCFTLTVTDPATGWTVCCSLLNKAQKWVVDALEEVLKAYPIPILEIHSDSGSEFINAHLFRWCQKHHLKFTRSRPNRKNDNCYVEQKNDDVVRKTVGYFRFAGEEDRDNLAALYAALMPIRNVFIPSAKLKGKHREGAKIIKTYDRPMTPMERLLLSGVLSSEKAEEMRLWRNGLSFSNLKMVQREALRKLLDLRSKGVA